MDVLVETVLFFLVKATSLNSFIKKYLCSPLRLNFQKKLLYKEINNTSLYSFLILYLLCPQLEHFIIFCSDITVVEKKIGTKRAIKQDKLIHGHEQK